MVGQNSNLNKVLALYDEVAVCCYNSISEGRQAKLTSGLKTVIVLVEQGVGNYYCLPAAIESLQLTEIPNKVMTYVRLFFYELARFARERLLDSILIDISDDQIGEEQYEVAQSILHLQKRSMDMIDYLDQVAIRASRLWRQQIREEVEQSLCAAMDCEKTGQRNI